MTNHFSFVDEKQWQDENRKKNLNQKERMGN